MYRSQCRHNSSGHENVHAPSCRGGLHVRPSFLYSRRQFEAKCIYLSIFLAWIFIFFTFFFTHFPISFPLWVRTARARRASSSFSLASQPCSRRDNAFTTLFRLFFKYFFSPYQWKRKQREIRVAEAALALFIYFCFIETFVYQVFRVGTTRCPAFAMRQFFRAREKNCRGQSVLPQPDVHKRPGRLSMYNIHNVVLCCCIGVVKRETSVRPLERKLPQPHEFASIRVQPCRMHTASRSVTRGKVHIAYFFFSSFQFFFPSLLCPFYSCSYGFTLYAS